MSTANTSDLSPSLSDNEDFINARRGLIEAANPCKVLAADGRVLWDNDAYNFLEGECPPTANPVLWRQGQLSAIQGLFEVTTSVYQIRGFDISNMTIIEGKTGIIVVDPLISAECAKAGLDFYSKHRGTRPVRALIFTHSHADHFGGAEGVLQGNHDIPIIAPDGFMEEATSENIVAGPAMRRRAAFMYGNFLPKSPTGQIGVGLGMNTSKGTNTLIPPNTLIKQTGDTLTLDGIRFVFQMVPDTEAPAEFNFHLPDLRTLCICECVSHTMHNIVTLRGAAVRDARAWSRHLDDALVLYGAQTDVLFSSHHWPTWGSAVITRFLSEQRDLYAFMHDQTVRLMNQGQTGTQIAETLTLPPGLATKWHAQGYYGSLSHNVKGIYQRYMTWFDGDPVNLWRHTPRAEGERYVECFGGVDALLRHAARYADEKRDLRFAATLLGHAVAAMPEHPGARATLADVLERLGFGAENATWRNFYLTGAMELRAAVGKKKARAQGMQHMAVLSPHLGVEHWLDSLCVMLDGLRAGREAFDIEICVVDQYVGGGGGGVYRLMLSNGALHVRRQMSGGISQGDAAGEAAGLRLALTKAELLEVLRGDMAAARRAMKDGDLGLLQRLFELTTPVEALAEGQGQKEPRSQL